MSDKRISVRESTRSRLLSRKKEVEGSVTYSEQLDGLLPDERPLVHDEPLVTISVDQDVYDRVDDLAGEGVSLREVIEFYLYLDELDGSVSPRQILFEVYRREQQN